MSDLNYDRVEGGCGCLVILAIILLVAYKLIGGFE